MCASVSKRITLAGLVVLALLLGWTAARARPQHSDAAPHEVLLTQPQEEADRKSAGCVTCHTATDEPTMHATRTVRLGCVDCHGGDTSARVEQGTAKDSASYGAVKEKAHVQPRRQRDRSFEAPVRAYTEWLKEDAAYIRFVNPGDLRVADQTCGTSGCHVTEARAVRTSMMSHGAMLWSAALYNNGGVWFKNPRYGESYGADGKPQELRTSPPPTPEETRAKGVLPLLEPLPRWETSQPGNVLRVFERGGGPRTEVGNPNLEESQNPGRPDVKLSDRGFGTLLRTDPVFLGLQKTRLLDPLLSLPGTNDQPGDYRGSGCTGCHVVYANDRAAAHSGPYAAFGNDGRSASRDPTINKNESGHPIRHALTRAVPSSQCMVCHVHPGTNMVASYFGYTWWDNEVDGERMYPKEQRDPSAKERFEVTQRNPEASAARGLWSDVNFLKQTGTPEFNARLDKAQFGDFHSHGWIFRAVFKRDRKGNLLDEDGKKIEDGDPKKFEKAVQLADIHMQKGMHCVDCHFTQDNHGNGKLYGETRNAIEISCVDCHGTIRERAKLVTSGPAAPAAGTHLERLRTPSGERQFYWRDGRLYQRSMIDPDKEWEVVQVLDTITPGNAHYSEQSRLAKTINKDGRTWGTVPAHGTDLAHPDERMTCFGCHTSWTTSCFGCHLSMTANQRRPMLHNEGLMTRNWTSYNFQVLRDDVYMLGIDGTPTGNKVAPVRSACAVLVSSQNQNRDWIYYMQQTVSAEGFSGQAFSPYMPHTVRAKETKRCSDCHVSSAGDNNAWMSQVLLLGTNFLNQMGRWVYVATGEHGYEAVAVAEHDDPPAVYGSEFQKVAYPQDYRRFVAGGRELTEAHEHKGHVESVQLRGEYLYAAMGKGGFRAFDVANIDNKDFSERMVTAPVSPLGQRLYVKTEDAADVASPSTLAVDPLRARHAENEEQPIHLMYGFLYVADRKEGLVVVGDPDLKHPTPGVGTLLDGNPANNFLTRALAFNPEHALDGARRIVIAGTFAYVLCDRGLVVVDLDKPLEPRVTAAVGAPSLDDPRGISIQFRYAFVVDRQGLKVLDVTDLASPKPVERALVPLTDAQNVYAARTYAYVAGGAQGLAIVDVERPEHPALEQMFTAEGQLNDTRDVRIGMVSSSQFAFVADGKNGLRVVQLFSPETPGFYGFSPRPTPKLIATRRTRGAALAVSKGIDRDRAVDESGNQVAVFGRRGSRPFNREEMRRMYLRDGRLYTVSDDPPQPAK
ncbi:MAG: hypothetical protein LAN37_07000 [Acidobacteriia bacterium]|nr:hypothetical protein [Terriglobia bacterium]